LAAGGCFAAHRRLSRFVVDLDRFAAPDPTGGKRASVVCILCGVGHMMAPAFTFGQRWRQFQALTKPRVIQLIVFCALIGMVLAVPGVPSWDEVRLGAVACLGIWLVAGAAAAFSLTGGKAEAAKAYLEFLYTDEAQDLAGKHFYRPRKQEILAKYAGKLPSIPLVTIDKDFGGWAKAQKTHFDDGGTFDQAYGTK
jgi:hypothetical protein